VKIPIQNIYYLLCYAWDHARQAEMVDVQAAGVATLPDLFGHVLAEGTTRLLQRGLDRGYIENEGVVGGVRGKLDLTTTLKRNLLIQARTHCHFDEFEYDVQHNRVLKATLRALARTEDLDSEIQRRVSRLYRKLDAVSDIDLDHQAFRSIQIHRNNRFYDFLISICRLVHENLIIDERSGDAKFHDFREDDVTMWQVFEDFVFHFYRREHSEFTVSRPHINWHDARGSEPALKRLPIMRTDVYLESNDRRIILDCKYTKDPLPVGQHGRGRVKTSNLYQIFAYVVNRAANEGQDPPHEGMLLYPVVRERFDHRYALMGHPISVRSIDLDQPWRDVHRDMLALLT